MLSPLLCSLVVLALAFICSGVLNLILVAGHISDRAGSLQSSCPLYIMAEIADYSAIDTFLSFEYPIPSLKCPLYVFIQCKMLLSVDQKVLYREFSVFESNVSSKSLLFRRFRYLDVRYSDPH